MKKIVSAALLAAAVLLTTQSAGMAAKPKPVKAKVTKKPAAKSPVKAPIKTPAKPKSEVPHVVQGTTQLKGEYAELDKAYTLGKQDPVNITLKSAEYSIDPIRIGDSTYVPGIDEKLLILHMVYHNPQPSERFVRWDSFGFTVVDPQDQNHDGLKDLGSEENKSGISMNMKPAQKMEVYGVMAVPAKGEMPKLIIKANDDLVLRYDLRGKVKGLPAPYADPADKTGATPLSRIAGQAGTYYPVGMLSFKLIKADYTDASQMGENELSEGERFFIVQFNVKNISGSDQYFRWDTFDRKLIDVDDVEVGSCIDVFQASKDKSFSNNIKPDQELTLRYLFSIPDDTDVKTFSVAIEGGRTFTFDISGTK